MEKEFDQLKLRLKGAWTGEGFAKFPAFFADGVFDTIPGG